MQINYFSFILLIGSTISFFVGYHNIDLSFNFINHGYTQAYDCGLFNICQTLQQAYVNGLKMITFSYIFSLIAILFLVYDLNRHNKDK